MNFEKYRPILAILFAILFTLNPFSSARADEISGELKKWHRISITFDGPLTSETDAVNPFLDYRLWVTFTHPGTGTTYVVPGFYAADGNAAITSADSGDKWRVHFTPDQTGLWEYSAEFITGSEVAVSLDPLPLGSSSAGFFDGNTGSFSVLATDKTGKDLRGKGRLTYVDGFYLQFAETGEYYLKNGIDSPENFLAYDEFDGTYDAGDKGCVSGELFLHNYPTHVADWNAGDPVWGLDDRGKGIIGAVNYMSQTHGNSMYMITFNTEGGDGCDVWPWTNDAERYRFDVSKLDQWEIVFSHFQKMGLQLHIVLAERENRQALENQLGLQRKLYYRELAARFSHHPVLQWNIGEEHNIANNLRREYAGYVRDVDPYDHPIAIHSTATDPMDFYINGSGAGEPILGAPMYDVSSIQGAISEYNSYPIILREQTALAGRPWAIYADEQTIDAPAGTDKEIFRHTHGTWGNLMGGGAGVEWFISADLTLETFTVDENNRLITQHAVDFFHEYLPFHEMEPDNSLSSNPSAFVFQKPGDVYAISLHEGGTTNLDLTGHTGHYTVDWYDPRNGGPLQDGSITGIQGDAQVNIGDPPSTVVEQWVALVRFNPSPVASIQAQTTDLTVDFDASMSTDDGLIESWSWDFGDGNSATGEFVSHTYGAAGTYDVTLTVIDEHGASGVDTMTLTVTTTTNNPPVAEFTASMDEMTASLDASGSSDDGSIVAWDWDLGDGSTGSGQTATHTYSTEGTYTVTLTVTDNLGLSSQSSQDVTAQNANIAPIANFSYSIDSLSVLFNDLSTDDGTVVSWSWDLGDGTSSTDQHPSHTYSTPDTFLVSLVVTDDSGATDDTSKVVIIPDPGSQSGSGHFIESGGLLVMESEHFHEQIDRGNHTWIFSSATGGYNGTGAMVADPNIGTDVRKPDVNVNSPELRFDANFETVGSYYVWVRIFALSDADNTIHLGLNGDVSASKMEATTIGSWTWTNVNTKGAPSTVGIIDPGPAVVHMWMREDGINVDRILLTTDVNYIPSGTGPPESPREGGTVNAPPVAGFDASINDLQVTFTDTSTDDGTIASYAWDFGDGNTSTSPDPVHAYQNAGTYTVSLVVTDDLGATGQTSQEITVTSSNAPPLADFTHTITDLQADFTDTSTDDGTIVGWTWDFGDGGSSSVQNPQYVYALADSYLVSLTVTDDVGANHTVSKYVQVTEGSDPPGTGVFLESGGLLVLEAENFHNQVLRADHSWDPTTSFADFSGTGAMEANPNNGTEVKKPDVIVSSPELIFDVNFTTTGTFYVWVRVFAPTDQDNSIHLGAYDVVSASKMETGTYGTWSWTNVNNKGALSTIGILDPGQTTVHVWMREDGLILDKIVLTADESFIPSGQGPPESPTDGPQDQAPTASFTSTTSGLDASFTDTSQDDGTIVSRSWDFGDGNSSTEQHPQHTYASAGTYSVSLTVTDDSGQSDVTTSEITVQLSPIAKISFTASDLTVAFTDSSSDDGTIVSWTWDFGDGNSSTEQHPQHTYASAGMYPVTLSVTDDSGLSDVDSVNVTVQLAPVAQIAFTISDLTVAFADSSSDDGSIVSRAWDFGDGNSSTEQHPQHTYASAGTYPVTLTVTDDSGLSNVDSVDVTVNLPPPANGPFLETNGLVVMEAENYFQNIDRSNHSWVETTDMAGFSGQSAMVTTPNVGTLIRKNMVNTDSPEMVYQVDISNPGTYYVWFHVYAPAQGDNTVHAGTDGIVTASKIETVTYGAWNWTNLDTKNKPVTVGIVPAGIYDFNVWMRDDGMYLDKILLTNDPAFVPTGLGPPESDRSPSAPLTQSSAADGGPSKLSVVEIPDDYVLNGNYPNPFNPTTTIRFGLPEAGHVSLTVYDLQGKIVGHLVNQRKTAGYHEVEWSAHNIPSGIYFYRIDVEEGQFSQTGKMVLLK